METALFILTITLILGAEFINGWTDAPNAIATVISTRALTPRKAILMAAGLNVVGAFSGTAVATTIGREIVEPEALNLATLSGAMLAVILWGLLAWKLGLPTSKSHALIAGLSGAALAEAGPSVLIWEGWSKVLIGLLIFTFIGALLGWAIASVIERKMADASPAKARRHFARLQIFSAGFMAFSHGSNDGRKFMGMFSLALLLGGILPSSSVPFWVIVICALTMGIGTSIGGMRIIRTMGFKIVHLETYQGFSAESAAASTIVLASFLGIPVSTTHTIGMSIVGVGYAHRPNALRLRIMGHILTAWVLTFPVCGLLAFSIVYLTNWFIH